MWEEVKHYAKLVGGWLGVRVINALGVMAASTAGLISKGALAPLVAIPVGLAFSSYVSSSENKMNERRLTNAYRHEIAALTGKHWKKVKVSDMQSLAENTAKAGAPSVEAFSEQLSTNNSRFWLSIASHVVGAAVAFAAVYFGFEYLQDFFRSGGEAIRNAAGSLGSLISDQRLPVPLAMATAGVISLTTDTAFGYIAGRWLGLNKPTIIEQVKDIKMDLREGKHISEERVFSLVLQANPGFDEGIREKYGQSFAQLPRRYREEIIQTFNKAYPILEITHAINEGALSANELSFLAYGQRSGLKAKPITEREKEEQLEKSKSPEITHKLAKVSEPAITALKPGHNENNEKPDNQTRQSCYDGRVIASALELRFGY